MPQRNPMIPPMGRRAAIALSASALIGASLGATPAEATTYSDSGTTVQTTADYRVPAVTLRDRFDHPVRLDRFLAAGRPVVMEFFFTSCPTICGLQNATLAVAQRQFVKISPNMLVVSISIDPAFDTPARIRAYAKPFQPLPNWHLLTGRPSDVNQVLSAFDATYPGGNKYLHEPLIYIRPATGNTWRRINGLLDSHQLVAAYRDVLSSAGMTASAR